jgi:hypothetical protein
MKRHIALAAAFAAVTAVGLAAQTASQTTEPAAGATKGQMVVYTGCIQSGAQSGSTAAAGSSAFILANPVVSASGSTSTSPTTTSPTTPPSATPPSSTPPTTAPPTSTPPSTTTPPTTSAPTPTEPPAATAGAVGTSGLSTVAGFRLVGGQPDTLKGLENQRVEIRGTFQSDMGASSAASDSAMRTLRVTSVRPVSGDCGAAK